MKRLSFVLALLTVLPAGAAVAGKRPTTCPMFSPGSCNGPARLASRHDLEDAVLAIDSQGGDAVLILDREVVALQLSDRTLRKVRRELRERQDETEDGPLGQAIRTAVFSVVRTVLNHSIQCPVRELRDVAYQDGRLIFTTRNGERVFEDIDMNDREVLANFSERDARAFVREFRRLRRPS